MYYAFGVFSLAGLAAAAWFSIVLARADHEFRKGTPEAVARAVELTPRNTAYLSLRALQVEYGGGDARPLLERMAALQSYFFGAAHPARSGCGDSGRFRDRATLAARRRASRPSIRACLDTREFLLPRADAARVLGLDAHGSQTSYGDQPAVPSLLECKFDGQEILTWAFRRAARLWPRI